MSIEKVVRKVKIEEQGNDFAFWQSQSYEARLVTLEQVRREFHFWKYDSEPGFQRVFSIVKQE
jgi:hypothetical protein